MLPHLRRLLGHVMRHVGKCVLPRGGSRGTIAELALGVAQQAMGSRYPEAIGGRIARMDGKRAAQCPARIATSARRARDRFRSLIGPGADERNGDVGIAGLTQLLSACGPPGFASRVLS